MAKKASPVTRMDEASVHDQKLRRGAGGELHQIAEDGQPVLTTAQGAPVADDQNTLRVGARGPALIEDFHFREKIFHFDHERIPERVVHARGYGAQATSKPTSRSPPIPAPTSSSAPARRRQPSSGSPPSPEARAPSILPVTCAVLP